MKKNTMRNSFLLFLTATIWGLAFVSQSKAMDYMGPLTFHGVRCLIGTLTLLIYILIKQLCTGGRAKALSGENAVSEENITSEEKINSGKNSTLSKETNSWKTQLQAGLWCGLAFTVAGVFQQVGIQYTSVGKAGFITTLYIIFVPILGIFIGKKIALPVWVGAAMAAVGMYLLCMSESLSLGKGDILVFLCAIAFAVHILLVDYYSPKVDGAVLACSQFFVCGILCTIGALIWEHPSIAQIQDGIGAILYAGVLSCGVAYTLQIIGQRDVNPTVAALIMSLESVISTVAAWVAYKIGFLTTDQTLTTRQITGCAIVFAAVILVQLPIGKKQNRQ